MLEKLEAIKKKWKEIEQKMNEPSAMANMKLFIKLNKDYKDLQPIVEGYDKLSLIVNNIESAKDVLNNEKMKNFVLWLKKSYLFSFLSVKSWRRSCD